MFSYLLKELKGQKSFVTLFIFNMALGMLGLILLLGFREGFEAALENNSRQLLSADLSIVTRKPLDKNQLSALHNILPPDTLKSEKTQFFTMVGSQKKRQLIAIRAIDQQYPLRGELLLQYQQSVTPSQFPKHFVWLSFDASLRLQASIGDDLKIGKKIFKVTNIITQDQAMDATGGAFAPYLYLHRDDLDETELLTQGALAWYHSLFKINKKNDISQIKYQIIDALNDSSIRVRSHSDASERSGRMLGILSDYLVLVSMASIFLATIGSVCLYRSFLLNKLRQLAIFISLGFSPAQAIQHLVIQLFTLASIATFLALLLSAVLLPQVSSFIGDLLPIPIDLTLTLKTVGITVLCSIGMSFLSAAPLLLKVKDLRPTILFQEHAQPSLPWSFKDIFYYLPGWIICYMAAVFLSGSFFLGSILSWGFMISGLMIGACCYFSLKIISVLSYRFQISTWRYSSSFLVRNLTPTLTIYIAIGLASFILTLIPTIQTTIEKQFSETHTKQASLFLYDIQPYQIDTFKGLLSKDKILRLSPMVSSKLLSINNRPFQTDKNENMSRQEQIAHESRNRSYNLSWRSDTSSHETILSGKPLSTWDESQKYIGLSIEERFADRLKVQLGDVLEFQIEGEYFFTQIQNLRRVQWTSFEPNFFLIVQDGALNDFPASWLAAVFEPDIHKQTLIQHQLADQMPNVSVIDVKKIIAQILKLIQQMTLILTTMSFLTGITALLILLAIYIQRSYEQKVTLARLIALGGQKRFLFGITYAEIFLTSCLPAAVGSIFAWPASEALSQIVFHQAAHFSGAPFLGSILSVTCVGGLIRLWLLTSSLRTPPALSLYD